jgi:hypothetical protein
MRDLNTMMVNVGTDVQDTSSAMGAIIKRYINKRYFDILRVCNLQPVNSTFLLSVTSLASLPIDFGKELYCMDGSNNPFTRIDIEEAVRITPSTTEYAIFTDQNGAKQIKIWNTTAQTLKIPYQVKPAELSSTTDTPLIPCEDIIEAGAIADTWRYKRQFQKAQAMEAVYADLMSNLIWDTENQPAYPRQFTPTTYSRDLL